VQTLRPEAGDNTLARWHSRCRPGLGRGNKKAATFSRSRFVVDYDFHVTIQGCEKLREPFNGKALELIVQQG
jgi:hypothetical protein